MRGIIKFTWAVSGAALLFATAQSASADDQPYFREPAHNFAPGPDFKTDPASGKVPPDKKAFDWSEFSSSVVIEIRRGDSVFTCSGVAITHSLVLTAAHCADGAPTAMRVSFDVNYNPVRGNFINVLPGGIYLHPGYNRNISNYDHDIAALKLAQKVPAWVKLPSFPMRDFAVQAGTRVERIGYGGRNGENRRTWTAAKLRKDTQGTLLVDDSLSVEGDSGGPLYYRVGKKLLLIGIHSTQISEDQSIEAAAVKIRDQTKWLQSAPFFVVFM